MKLFTVFPLLASLSFSTGYQWFEQGANAEIESDGVSVAAEVQPEQAPVRRNEACLRMFELTGPVENCRVGYCVQGEKEIDGETYERFDIQCSRDYLFNRRGYLIADGCSEYTYRADTVFIYGEDPLADMSATLTYDAEGRITTQKLEYKENAEGDGQRTTDYFFDDAGRLVRTYTALWELAEETFFTYDDQGRLASSRQVDYGYDGNTESNYTYEYVKFDEYGNWTQRNVLVKRSRTEAEEGAEHERSVLIHIPDTYEMQIREITYYQ